jgi:peptidoglycan/LPS O-acetylase OafA/YrhL
MTSETGARQSRNNNFGVLRLLFAALVIVCHSCVLLDGSKNRDPLFRLTHTVTLGDFAVDGFFLISGYLVLQSLIASESAFEFLGKRVLRVYPGYLVACLFSLLLGSVAGGIVPANRGSFVAGTAVRMVYLNGVGLEHAFYRNPMLGLNGSLWTIAYEFRSYICLLFLGMLRLSRRRNSMTILALALVYSTLFLSGTDGPFRLDNVLGTASSNLRFFSLFATGSAFLLWRDRIRWSKSMLVLSVALLAVLLPSRFSTGAIALAGGYAVFWLALGFYCPPLARFTDETDLSYGIYLYGWPISQTIIWFFPTVSRWSLCALTLLMTSCVAFLSWRFVEKPALKWKKLLLNSSGRVCSPIVT